MEECVWFKLVEECQTIWGVTDDIILPDYRASEQTIVRVFDEVQAHVNWGRFVTFVIWLHRDPEAFHLYQILLRHRKREWEKGLKQLKMFRSRSWIQWLYSGIITILQNLGVLEE